ncbi:hypothetical protein Vadar_012437 [Vaccinium darrowii]|uniref:Uncharacterized protein n=1 Tax=Vaccinium darrowii TaxID=229202 RepID=A0ACB7XR75_9ERIC|nr:hypothetical protein Vadar_012437 [Vaccinium darrowii]
MQLSERTKERIRELFNKVQLSVSSYDTAWVAMVPSRYSSGPPCFPQCIDWLLDNQLGDGSWGLPHHSLLIKDALSSTLASVLALKRWGVGEEQINKGLHIIWSNVTSATDESEYSPIGFDIIFRGMVEDAKEFDLNLPFEPKVFNSMIHRRELELRGTGKWPRNIKGRMALFNCPSSTAAAFMHLQDASCLKYLHSLLEEFGNAVPTVYPLDIHARLCTVDNVKRLGIERPFRQEIKSVLDDTYRCWLQGEEEIFLDAATCAMAFRILCYNGASEIIIYPHESALEEQHSWSGHFLKEKLQDCIIHSDRFNKYVSQEVDDTLKFPFHANLEHATIRRNIEHYYVDSTTILKTSYCSSNIRNEDFLNLAVEDFNICQSIHHEELKYLERWVAEARLDKLKFTRQKTAYCYFSTAATLFSPELSDARISWAKNGVLATVVDDFFDIGGSLLELDNLIQLVEKHVSLHSFVRSIFYSWLDLLRSMEREAKWTSDQSLPTLEEYMSNGFVSSALGPIVLRTLYLVGPILSDDVSSSEYQNLFKILGTSGCLLNDIHSFERESKAGKLNAVSLHVIHSSGAVFVEESIKDIRGPLVQNLFYMKDDGFTSNDMIHVVKAILHEPLSLSE